MIPNFPLFAAFLIASYISSNVLGLHVTLQLALCKEVIKALYWSIGSIFNNIIQYITILSKAS